MFLNYKFDEKIALKESKEVCEITLQYKTIQDKQ